MTERPIAFWIEKSILRVICYEHGSGAAQFHIVMSRGSFDRRESTGPEQIQGEMAILPDSMVTFRRNDRRCQSIRDNWSATGSRETWLVHSQAVLAGWTSVCCESDRFLRLLPM